jgi:hypothetical protein
MTAMIYGKLNRARLYSQTFVRTFDGVGNMQLVLPDFPVTGITALQQGSCLVPPAEALPLGACSYGYRFVPWSGNLPGDVCVIEFVGGSFYTAAQNVQVTYQAGYLVANEPQTVSSLQGPYVATVLQQQGIWCRDNGVTYAVSGLPLTPVKAITGVGQYIVPPDTSPGLYTFGSADAGAALLISYSFIPTDLEEACIQMVAERLSYRSRIGEMSKSLGGQETVRFLRGSAGRPYANVSALPPEVMDLISPYVSVVPPAIGSPV